jgi:hypothetical protein
MENEVQRLRNLERKVAQFEAKFGQIDRAIDQWEAKFRKIDVALGWHEEKMDDADTFLDKLDEGQLDLHMRLEGLEDYLGMPRNGRQGMTLYDGNDAVYVSRAGDRAEHYARQGMQLQSLPEAGVAHPAQNISAPQPSATASASNVSAHRRSATASGSNIRGAARDDSRLAQPVVAMPPVARKELTTTERVSASAMDEASASALAVTSQWATSDVPAPRIEWPPHVTLTPPTPHSSQQNEVPLPHAPPAAPVHSPPPIPTNVPGAPSPQLPQNAGIPVVGTSDPAPSLNPPCNISPSPATQSPPPSFSPPSLFAIPSTSTPELTSAHESRDTESAHVPISASLSPNNESAVMSTTNGALGPQPLLPPSPPWRVPSRELPMAETENLATPSGPSEIPQSSGLLIPPAGGRSRSRSRGPPTRRSPRLGSPMPMPIEATNPSDVDPMNVDR